MGTASGSLLNYFGLNQEDKTVMNVVVTSKLCKCLLNDLIEKGRFNEHGKGIAFSIPLSSATKYMVDFYENQELEDIEMVKENPETKDEGGSEAEQDKENKPHD